MILAALGAVVPTVVVSGRRRRPDQSAEALGVAVYPSAPFGPDVRLDTVVWRSAA